MASRAASPPWARGDRLLLLPTAAMLPHRGPESMCHLPFCSQQGHAHYGAGMLLVDWLDDGIFGCNELVGTSTARTVYITDCLPSALWSRVASFRAHTRLLPLSVPFVVQSWRATNRGCRSQQSGGAKKSQTTTEGSGCCAHPQPAVQRGRCAFHCTRSNRRDCLLYTSPSPRD